MKISEMVRYIKKRGCRLQRHGGSHDIWVNIKTGAETSIPRHFAKELPTGTAAQILKDLGLK